MHPREITPPLTAEAPASAWFDAHLDLAYLAVGGRDMLQRDPLAAGGHLQPASITLASLTAGHVRGCFGTIFCEPDGEPGHPAAYPASDAEAARREGVRQLDIYRAWHDAGHIVLGAAELLTKSDASPMHVHVLMEGADPVRDADELGWWKDRGVRGIGLAWARASRYAAGNATPSEADRGITRAGRDLVQAIDALGMFHDVSHLSDRSLADLLSLTERALIASHSNCRAIVDRRGDQVRQRHLTDDTIREIARRGGMIGLNLFSAFIVEGGERNTRASVEQWADHVEHAAEVAGRRNCLGLGSDADGGFSAEHLPQGISVASDFGRLTAELSRRGWNQAECEGFAYGNWMRWHEAVRVRPVP